MYEVSTFKFPVNYIIIYLNIKIQEASNAKLSVIVNETGETVFGKVSALFSLEDHYTRTERCFMQSTLFNKIHNVFPCL